MNVVYLGQCPGMSTLYEVIAIYLDSDNIKEEMIVKNFEGS